MSEELKLCPFCGDEVHTTETARYLKRYGVSCRCGASMRFFDTEAEAIAAWNTRYHCGLTDEDYNILLDELGVSERTCECVAEYSNSPIDGKTIVLHRCSACHELMRPHMNYCPHCGAKVIEEKGKGNDGE